MSEVQVSLPTQKQALNAQILFVGNTHSCKKHWNTIILDDSVSSLLIKQMIEKSYRLVVMSLKKADRERVLSLLDAE